VDFELLERLAKGHPEWNFVLIGEIYCDISRLQKQSNVHFLGRREHCQLPAYCKGFDVGIIPYDMKQARMESVNPVKTKEILAAGVPVVAADVPELRVTSDGGGGTGLQGYRAAGLQGGMGLGGGKGEWWEDVTVCRTVEEWEEGIRGALEGQGRKRHEREMAVAPISGPLERNGHSESSVAESVRIPTWLPEGTISFPRNAATEIEAVDIEKWKRWRRREAISKRMEGEDWGAKVGEMRERVEEKRG